MEKQRKKNSAVPWGKWNWCCNVFLQAVFACVIVLVMLWSTGRLIAVLFPELQFSGWVFVFGGAVAAGSSMWNTVCSERFQKKWLRHIGNLLLFVILAIALLRVAYVHADQLEQGFLYVEQLIEEKINHYKGISDAVNDAAGSGSVIVAQGASVLETCGVMFLNLAATAVFLILQAVSAERKKGIWLALLPVSVLIFGLFVGKAPDFAGLAGTIVCLILLASVSWNKKKQIGASGLLTGMLVGSLVIAVAVCSVAADWFASKESQMLPVQKKLERQITKLFSGTSDVQNGKISNKYPVYTGEEMLHVQTNEEVENTLYLRGTYADTYKNGEWTREKEFTLTADQFSRYEDCQDLDPVMAVADESSRKYLDLLESGTSTVGYGLPETFYEIAYTGLKSDIMYLPYGPETDTLSWEYTAEGDYQFRKQKNMMGISVSAIGGHAERLGTDVMISDLCYNSKQKFSRYDAFYEAYNQYVQENYLDVPENMPALEKAADQLREEFGDAVRLLSDPEQGNAARLVICSNVGGFLELSYSYQKNIPDPGDTDPVEFFLKEQNGGFCVHFASAGVLLLRELGVPARYVSGYKVDSSEFKLDTSQVEKSYECSVPDSDAHAWVEIYLDDYGWVPGEMTPSEETSAELDKSRGKSNDTEQDTTVSDQTPENQNPQETQPADQPTQDEPAVSEAQTNQASKGGANDAGETKQSVSAKMHIDWGKVAKVFIPIAAAVIVLIFVSQEKKRRAVRWKKELERAVKNGRYSRAARMQNLKFYRWLIKNKKLSGKRMKDREYAESLQKLYPEQDWTLYLQILQKAVYGDTELTEEEYATLKAMIRAGMDASKK